MKVIMITAVIIGSIYYGFLAGRCFQHFETVLSGNVKVITLLGEIK